MINKTFFNYLFLLSLLQLFSGELIASVNIGVGAYTPFPSTQKEDDGTKDTWTADPYVSIGYNHKLSGNYIFTPQIGYVFHSSLDDEYSKKTLFTLLDFGYTINSRFTGIFGLGTFRTTISGDGGTVVLQNGDGTANFFAPSTSVTSYNTTVDLGLDAIYNKNFATRFQIYLFEILSSEKRSMSYSVAVNYFY